MIFHGFCEPLANYYWSVPLSLARKTITEWHPDVTPEQFDRVLEAETNRKWPELVLVTEGVPEPELALGSLFEFLDGDYGGIGSIARIFRMPFVPKKRF